MKRILLVAAMLVVGLNVYAQEGAEQSKWKVRLRGVWVAPQESAEIGVIGGDADISKSFIPELDFTYFFNQHFAAELILGTTRHKVSASGSDLSAIGGANKANVDLGKVWLLPPTLTFQYHQPLGAFHPYVGAGVNYTIFYSADQGPVVKDISYKNKFAFAAQLGLDYDISSQLFLNIDVKKIFLSTDVKVDASNLSPAGNAQLATVLSNIPADVKIKPWLIGVGIGYKF